MPQVVPHKAKMNPDTLLFNQLHPTVISCVCVCVCSLIIGKSKYYSLKNALFLIKKAN
ncbi:MAG: hypothetical protein LBP72_06655 [Dysgonamonadaceae bacterium]|nr:hypothetical protein [Dysgonamonadaceae bacterium]